MFRVHPHLTNFESHRILCTLEGPIQKVFLISRKAFLNRIDVAWRGNLWLEK
jgi:hypothetical protein